MRLVSYNIRLGGRGRREVIAEVLRRIDADLVILQEAVDPSVVEWLGGELGLAVVAAGAGRSVAALSRLDADGVTWHRARAGRMFLEIDLRADDLRLFGVHLTAGLSRWGERRRLAELAVLLPVVRAGAGLDASLVVGDFNAIAPGDEPLVASLPRWIRILLRFDGGIRTEVMTELHDTGLTDAFRRAHPAELGVTMPAADPSVRLDYVFAGSRVAARILDCAPADLDRGLLARASDHLPLVATLAP